MNLPKLLPNLTPQLVFIYTCFLFLKFPSVDFEAIFESFQLKLTNFLSFFSSFLSDFFNWAVTFWQLTLKIVCPTLAILDRAGGGHHFDTLDSLEDGGDVLVGPFKVSGHENLLPVLPVKRFQSYVVWGTWDSLLLLNKERGSNTWWKTSIVEIWSRLYSIAESRESIITRIILIGSNKSFQTIKNH